jgi:hypothetical protein
MTISIIEGSLVMSIQEYVEEVILITSRDTASPNIGQETLGPTDLAARPIGSHRYSQEHHHSNSVATSAR